MLCLRRQRLILCLQSADVYIRAGTKMLEVIPKEIIARIFEYCDGKLLSTLSLSLAACNTTRCQFLAFEKIPEIAINSLMRIASDVGKVDDSDSQAAAAWIYSILPKTSTTREHETYGEEEHSNKNPNRHSTHDPSRSVGGPLNRLETMRILSENFAVLDFLRESCENSPPGCHEWPVWIGKITIHVNVDGLSKYTSARIQITSPMQAPGRMPGSSLVMENRIPMCSFRCEPMNMVPIAPWGCIRGLTDMEETKLAHIARDLEGSGDNHVAVPAFHHETDPLDVRIVTRKQALERRDNFPFLLFQSRLSKWIDRQSSSGERENNPLLCFWQDDSLGSNDADDRDYISYMIELMRTRRLLQV